MTDLVVQCNGLQYIYTIFDYTARSLTLTLSESSFDFTTLLHTYFKVADASKTTVSGLNTLEYIDKVWLVAMDIYGIILTI